MPTKSKKIISFKDLKAWQEAHGLVLIIYKITKKFPKDEMFGLVSQMRRCAVSIVSNIVEGFARRNKKEKIQFYSIARASLVELQSQILIAKDIDYLPVAEFDIIVSQLDKVHKLINGLNRKINQRM
jgi:four helix bundle protein